MKRTARVSYIIQTLNETPNKLYPLSYFSQKLKVAKSSISEDISVAKEVVSTLETGTIQTISGPLGGVIFKPHISDIEINRFQNEICKTLSNNNRFLGNGFIYTSDIMFNPNVAENFAKIFFRKFKDKNIDYVATIETKGIPLAMMTAKLLNVPLIVVRRASKISEGTAVSINYFSGTSNIIQKMTLAQKSIHGSGNAIIIDDFMRGGGSIKGITELLSEFEIKVVGVGVAIVATKPKYKKINQFTPVLHMGTIDEEKRNIELFPNYQIF